MKKIILFIILSGGYNYGQIQTPQPSPFSSIEQVIGLTDVKINYSRPAMRNRKIMGDLVPFGELWRAGANANTTIEFSDDVIISGQNLSAGKYAIFIRPGVSMWEVFFYNKIGLNDNRRGTRRDGDSERWSRGRIVEDLARGMLGTSC